MQILDSHREPSDPAPAYNQRYVWSVCLIVALGGLLFGYDWIVISGADLFYEKYFHLASSSDIGWAKSCALVGCMIGAMASGALSDRYGRKKPLMLAAFLFVVSSLGTGWSHQFLTFVCWRIVGGVAIGIASNLSPVYIGETAPTHIRGKLVSINQLTIVIGILLAQVVNWLIAQPVPPAATPEDILHSWNGQTGWRWMFAATAIPSFLFLVGLQFVPESPRWLMKNGKRQLAREVLSRIHGDAIAKIQAESIEATMDAETPRTNLAELFAPKTRKLVLMGVLLVILQQWCGINVIFYYTKDVFREAGFQVSDILLNIVIIGSANLLFTLLAIATVEKLGRRVLMLAGWAGLAVLHLAMGAAYFCHLGKITVVLIVASIGCYACTLAPMTWVILSEIFPNRIRGTAMSIAVLALWVACFSLTYTFPILSAHLGAPGIFWLYSAICIGGYFFCYARLSETKGKSLEQIELELSR